MLKMFGLLYFAPINNNYFRWLAPAATLLFLGRIIYFQNYTVLVTEIVLVIFKP